MCFLFKDYLCCVNAMCICKIIFLFSINQQNSNFFIVHEQLFSIYTQKKQLLCIVRHSIRIPQHREFLSEGL